MSAPLKFTGACTPIFCTKGCSVVLYVCISEPYLSTERSKFNSFDTVFFRVDEILILGSKIVLKSMLHARSRHSPILI